MNNKIKKNDVVVVKFITAEQIVAKATEVTDDTVTLKVPLSVYPGPKDPETGEGTIQMAYYAPVVKDETITVEKNKTIYIEPSSDSLKDNYLRLTGEQPSIVMPPEKKLIGLDGK